MHRELAVGAAAAGVGGRRRAVARRANTDASSALAVTVANGRWKLDGDEVAAPGGRPHGACFSGIPSAHPMKIWQDNEAPGARSP